MNRSEVFRVNELSWSRHALQRVSLTTIVYSFVVVLVSFVSGCSMFDLNEQIPWLDSDGKKIQPTRMTVLWTHTVLNQPDQKGVRGFGGRIMFHGKGPHEAEKLIKVEGTLVVYAFDETMKSKTSPQRKFVFTAEQFENHYSKSKLGHSYSIWLPWDEVGGTPRKINLIARFEPVGGGTIMSESSLRYLPGIEPELKEDDSTDSKPYEEPEIQQMHYQQIESSGEKPRRLPTGLAETETIDLPPSFSRRLQMPTGDDEYRDESNQEVVPAGSDSSTKSVPAKSSDRASSTKSSIGDSRQVRKINGQKALRERQRELSNHFGPRQSPVPKGTSAQSAPSDPPSRRSPRDEDSADQESQ